MFIIYFDAQKTKGAQFELVRYDVVETLQTGGEAIAPRNIAKWRCRLPFVQMTDEEATSYRGKLAELTRRSNRFQATPPGFESSQYVKTYWNGSAWTTGTAFSGQPLIDGPNQTGSTINFKNLVPSTLFLERGDFIEIANSDFGSELKVVTADCIADASGNATLSITPDMRIAPFDDGEVNLINPSSYFRLTSSQFEYQLQPNKIHTITIEGIEGYD